MFPESTLEITPVQGSKLFMGSPDRLRVTAGPAAPSGGICPSASRSPRPELETCARGGKLSAREYHLPLPVGEPSQLATDIYVYSPVFTLLGLFESMTHCHSLQ